MSHRQPPSRWLHQSECWRRLLKVPWISNQSILREINPEYSSKGLILKLKLQYFGHLMRTADSLEKSPVLGKFKGRRRKGRKRMRWLDGITNPMDMNLGKLWEMVRNRDPGVQQSKGSQRIKQDWATEQQVSSPGNISKKRVPLQALGGKLRGSLTGVTIGMDEWVWQKVYLIMGFPGGTSDKEPTCQCRGCKRCGSIPWVRKILWQRAWRPTPVFSPGESHGQRSLVGYSP